MNLDIKSWTRWEDWVVVVAGGYAALSTLWTDQMTSSRSALIALGVLMVLTAFWSLAEPGAVSSEYVHAALGVLMFVAPWVLGYVSSAGASWTSWVVGAVAAVMGLLAVPASTKVHRAAVGQH